VLNTLLKVKDTPLKRRHNVGVAATILKIATKISPNVCRKYATKNYLNAVVGKIALSGDEFRDAVDRLLSSLPIFQVFISLF
jgi:hypothetical protein